MKRLMAIGLVLILTLGFATIAYASPRWHGHGDRFHHWDGGWGGHGRHFWDESGNFLSRYDVEASLDAAVAAGTITFEYRDFILERYDFCSIYGGGAFGGCRGGWQGRGRGRW